MPVTDISSCIMKSWLFVIFALSLMAPAFAQTRIVFSPGSDSGVWSGYVEGRKIFILQLSKGQQFWVNSNDVYTWSVVAPSGKRLGCGHHLDATHCPPGSDVILPENGDYAVETDYRMSGGALGPHSSRRYVTVTFTVR